MRQYLFRYATKRSIFVLVLALVIVLCGLMAFASSKEPGENQPETPTPTSQQIRDTSSSEISTSKSKELNPANELYPTDVQRIINDSGRQIVKTYILSPGESPGQIPQDSFERDGWTYTLTDITKTSKTDTREHVETVTIKSDSSELNEIMAQLSPDAGR